MGCWFGVYCLRVYQPGNRLSNSGLKRNIYTYSGFLIYTTLVNRALQVGLIGLFGMNSRTCIKRSVIKFLNFFPLMLCQFHHFSAVVSIKRLWSSLTESYWPVQVVWYGYLGRNLSNKMTNSLSYETKKTSSSMLSTSGVYAGIFASTRGDSHGTPVGISLGMPVRRSVPESQQEFVRDPLTDKNEQTKWNEIWFRR